MNQGTVRALIVTIVSAALVGAFVLFWIPEYRQAKILESNRAYMPGIRPAAPPASPVPPPPALPQPSPTGTQP